MGGGRGGDSAVTRWVQAHGTAVTGAGAGNGTLYQLTA